MPKVTLRVTKGPKLNGPWLNSGRPELAAIRGQRGDTDYLCGTCNHKVARDLIGNQAVNGLIDCPVCQSELQLPAS